jgi:hypothetical protein
MALRLQIDQAVNRTAQPVKDQQGTASALSVSAAAVGVGTTTPRGTLDVAGNVVMNGNTKTQLVATGNAVSLKGSPITLDLSPAGGGQLVIGNNTNDNKIFIEGFSSDGAAHAAEMLITGRHAQSLPLLTLLATTTRMLGALQLGSNVNAAFNIQPSDTSPNAAYIRFGDNTGWKLHFGRTRESSLLNAPPLNTGTAGVVMTIQDNGNVGIGTLAPSERLVVEGNIRATGDVILTGADCAEDFDVHDAPSLEPGTVMVIGDAGRLRQSEDAYDTRVAGVLSGAGDCRPGIILDKQQSKRNRLPVALTGKVFCKVDARYAAVRVGDLLTSSPTRGHAMKAGDPLKAFGAVIGKALRPLAEGQGLIPILIALH